MVKVQEKVSAQAAEGSKGKRGRRPGGIIFPRNSLNEAVKVAASIWNDNAGRSFAIGIITV